MSKLHEVPVMMTDGSENAVRPQSLMDLDSQTNFAEDEAAIDFVQNSIVPLLRYCRDSRRPLEAQWREIDQIMNLQHNTQRKYMGRSDIYLPIGRRILGTLESNLSQGLFPSDDYMDVSDRGTVDPMLAAQRAKNVKAYMQWEFERCAHVRKHSSQFIRSFARYGNAVMKYWYSKERRYERRPANLDAAARRIMQQAAMPIPQQAQYVMYEGLRVSPRNIYSWYAYPFTAPNLDECSITFEDIDVSQAFLEDNAASGYFNSKNVEELLNFMTEEPKRIEERAEKANLQNMVDVLLMTRHSKHGVQGTLTEVWTYMPVPRSLYTPDERPGCYVPVHIILSGEFILRIARNPWAHQTPPYLFQSRDTPDGWLWGRGYGQLITGLQYLVNDTVNQMNDCGMYAMNPIVLRNVGLAPGKLPPLKPGRMYDVHGDGAIKFEHPPGELIQYGYSMLQAYMGLMEDLGGTPPIMQGSAAGKGAKTATGMQLLQRNASVPLADEIEDIEQGVMIPLLHRGWLLAQQFRDANVMVTVGGENLQITPEMLAIDAEFRWLASSQAVNSSQRAQQAIQMLSVIGPLIPLLQQQGKQVDLAVPLQKLWNDGFGFRGFDQFVKSMPMAPPGMPGMPGMPPQGGAPTPEGNAGMSAIPGAEGVPGEGEEFANVRDNADELAALLGGGGGGGF